MKVIDLKGQKFGKLTVLERVESDKNGKARWLCQCECGNTKIIKSANLRNGDTKSCGCLQREEASFRKKIILNPGDQFYYWTVLEEAENKTKDGRIKWKCQCICGTIAEVSGKDLRNGKSKSCGCIKSHGEFIIASLLKNNNISFEKEKTFDSCRFKDTNTLAKFDFYVDNQYIIEFDGKQHFTDKNVGWGESLESIQKRDEIKNEWCYNNNIPLIRIPYTKYETLSLNDLLLETSQYIYKRSD